LLHSASTSGGHIKIADKLHMRALRGRHWTQTHNL
jgi:hypothetical protein